MSIPKRWVDLAFYSGVAGCIISFFTLILLITYNIWSPGCSFSCYGEGFDQFEVNLFLTWIWAILLPSAAALIVGVIGRAED